MKVTGHTSPPNENVRLHGLRCPPSSTLSRCCGWTNIELLVSSGATVGEMARRGTVGAHGATGGLVVGRTILVAYGGAPKLAAQMGILSNSLVFSLMPNYFEIVLGHCNGSR